MPTYEVLIRRHFAESKTVRVEADDEDEAKEIALEDVDDSEGEWHKEGVETEDVESCTEVDESCTEVDEDE